MNENEKHYSELYEKKIRSEAAKIRNILINEYSKCELCGSDQIRDLQLHHVIPVRMYGDNSLNNLICVCRKCHSILHKTYRNTGNISKAWKCFVEAGMRMEYRYPKFVECLEKYENGLKAYKQVFYQKGNIQYQV